MTLEYFSYHAIFNTSVYISEVPHRLTAYIVYSMSIWTHPFLKDRDIFQMFFFFFGGGGVHDNQQSRCVMWVQYEQLHTYNENWSFDSPVSIIWLFGMNA